MVPVPTQSIQPKSVAYKNLFQQGMLDEAEMKKFGQLEKRVLDEIHMVQQEADELVEGWGQQIWREAMGFYNQKIKPEREQRMKQQQEGEEEKKETQQQQQQQQQQPQAGLFSHSQAAAQLLQQRQQQLQQEEKKNSSKPRQNMRKRRK